MPAQDITAQFVTALQSNLDAHRASRNGKIGDRGSAGGHTGTTEIQTIQLHPRSKRAGNEDPFTKEAYRIPVTVPLLTFDLDSDIDANVGSVGRQLKTIEVREVTEAMRDEIDAQVVVFLKKGLEMVGNLKVALDESLPPPLPTLPSFASLLPADSASAQPPAPPTPTVRDHRLAVLWHLEHQLMLAAKAQKEMRDIWNEKEAKRREIFEPRIYDPLIVKPVKKNPPPSATSPSRVPTPFSDGPTEVRSSSSPPGRFPSSSSTSPAMDPNVDPISRVSTSSRFDSNSGEEGSVAEKEKDFARLFDSHSGERSSESGWGLRQRNAARARSGATANWDITDTYTNNSSLPPEPAIDTERDDDFLASLTSEELQLLEQEQELLAAELHGRTQAAMDVAQTVSEIAQMQAQMAQHLEAQDETVSRVYMETHTTVATLAKANEYLRSAVMTGSDLTMMAIVFFWVMAFVVLFLDWYG
ncbi:hypothetical protein HDU93_005547 [Gonapodya sp. JEL0774]|nr:hypothetical protein HDU93_005547 [Gonapodya sp. JEL0774]